MWNLINIILASLAFVVVTCDVLNESSEFYNQQILDLIENSVNRSVDPCDDFYSYACGNWPNHHKQDEMLRQLEYDYFKAIEKLFDDKYPRRASGLLKNQTFFENVLNYYHSCEDNKIEDFDGYFHHIKPSENMEWPLLQEAQAFERGDLNFRSDTGLEGYENFDIFQLAAQLNSFGLGDTLIQLGQMLGGDNQHYIIILAPENTEMMGDLLPFVLKKLCEDAKIPEPLRQNYIDEILETEKWWKSIYQNHSEFADTDVKQFGDLQTLYPRVANFIEEALPHAVNNETYIFLRSTHVLYLLEKQWKPEEIRKLCNYAMAKLYDFWRDDYYFDNNCAWNLGRSLNYAADYIYYSEILLPHAKEFHNSLENFFGKLFQELSHLVSENRMNLTAEKLEGLHLIMESKYVNFGNLPEDVEFHEVNEFYKRIPDLDPQDYFKNDILVRKAKYFTTIIPSCPETMDCVHALKYTYNHQMDNRIIVDFSLLRSPMYHWKMDPLFTLAGLGTTLAHEFNHWIDSKNLKRYQMFSESDPNIEKAIECMQEQEPTDAVNERESDLVGARVAFRTYKREYNVQPKFTNIPWDQLFFLTTAQYHCFRAGKFMTVQHDSDDIRVRQIAKNMEEFSKAFNCPVGSRMNPEKKCRFY